MRSKKRGIHKNQLSLFDYNYEETFRDRLLEFHASDFKEAHKAFGLGYATKTIKSGNQFEIEMYPYFRKGFGDHFNETVVKKKPTRKEQRNLNRRNAKKYLERLIHCNFKAGDYWGTWTFEENPESIKDVRRLFKNAILSINRKRKRLGLENAKYIYVLEQTPKGRWHIHFIMDNDLEPSDVAVKWKHGYSDVKRIKCHGDEDLTALAKYMSKDREIYPEYSNEDVEEGKGERLWDSSQHLEKPEVRVNKTKFRKKDVLGMARDQSSIQEVLEKKYCNHDFKSCEVRYNEYNGLFYVYARMQEKRNQRIRI